MGLQVIWYVLVAVLLSVYVVLDGADLGIATLYPFLGRNRGQQAVLKACTGPVWNGNEGWLLIAVLSAFIVYPAVWTLASRSFYPVLVLVLFGLVLRVVGHELGEYDDNWSSFWDAAYFLGSAIPALVFGGVIGNIIRGIPITTEGSYAGTISGLLNPFAVLVAVTGLVAFIMQGAAWATMTTEGEVHNRAHTLLNASSLLLIVLLAALTVVSAVAVRQFAGNVVSRPAGWLSLVLAGGSLTALRVAIRRRREVLGWVLSAISTVALICICASGAYPYVVRPIDSGSNTGLTIADASARRSVLAILLAIAVVACSLLLAHTVRVYRTHRGRATPRPGGGAAMVRRV